MQKCRKENLPVEILIKVSFQRVVALAGHFATLYQELDFNEVFFYIIDSYSEESLKESYLAQIFHYEHQSAGKNVQSPQSVLIKVSFQGVVALAGHFATLCQERDFYEAFFFSLLIFKKKRQIL